MSKIEELSNQTGNEPIKPELIYKNEQVPNSPIWIRGNKETGYFATLGDYRITEPKDLITLESEIYEKDWNLIINVIVTVMQQVQKAQADEINIKQ